MKRSAQRLIALPVIVFSMMFIIATAMASTTYVTGFVTEKGGKYVLLTTNDVYILEGDALSTEMVGKEITVTGTVETKNEVKTIIVYIYDKIEE